MLTLAIEVPKKKKKKKKRGYLCVHFERVSLFDSTCKNCGEDRSVHTGRTYGSFEKSVIVGYVWVCVWVCGVCGGGSGVCVGGLSLCVKNRVSLF